MNNNKKFSMDMKKPESNNLKQKSNNLIDSNNSNTVKDSSNFPRKDEIKLIENFKNMNINNNPNSIVKPSLKTNFPELNKKNTLNNSNMHNSNMQENSFLSLGNITFHERVKSNSVSTNNYINSNNLINNLGNNNIKNKFNQEKKELNIIYEKEDKIQETNIRKSNDNKLSNKSNQLLNNNLKNNADNITLSTNKVNPITTKDNKSPEVKITNTLVKQFDSNNENKIYNQYKIIKEIGLGSYAKVKLVLNTKDNKHYCFKVISRMSLERKKKYFGRDDEGNAVIYTMFDDAKNEMEILQKINSSYIVNMHELIINEEEKKYYMVIDYIEQGSLMTYNDKNEKFVINKYLLSKSKNQKLIDEIFIKKILFYVAKAIHYLHSSNVVHRDIKPDNILLDNNLIPRLSDFSLAADIKGKDEFKKTEGNLYFYSPELCQGKKSFEAKPCDIWAYGVCAYLMIYHELPIMPANKNNTLELLGLIKEGKVDYAKNLNNKYYSEDLIKFVKQCLVADPLTRLTSNQLISHSYFAGLD
jgi:tRNA A-37 threonylcarbamoyl transferase component Bud32